jgi:tetratricopeptide (TPR) repeat protein
MTTAPPRHRWLAAALAVIALLVAAAPAIAEPASAPSPAELDAARSLFRRAEAEYVAGRHAEALALYRAAHAVVPEPKLLFNIAQCHRALGQYQLAIDVLRQYLAARDGDDTQASGRLGAVCVASTCIEALIAELERRQAAVAALDPTPDPTPALPPPAETAVAVETARTSAPIPAAPPAKRTPIYRRWWFITGAAAAVVAAGVTTALVVQRDPCGGYDACFGR